MTKVADVKGVFYMSDILDTYKKYTIRPIFDEGSGLKLLYILTNGENQYIFKTFVCSKDDCDELEKMANEFKAYNLLGTDDNVFKLIKMKKFDDEANSEFHIEALYTYEGDSMFSLITMIDARQAYTYAKQLLNLAVKLEENKQHMNFHPENILIANGKIRVIDFSFIETTSKKPKRLVDSKDMTTFCYNYAYCPPEVCREEKKTRLNKVDVYCWGMTIYHMISRKTYNRLNWELTEYKAKSGHYNEFIKEINKLQMLNDKGSIITDFMISVLVKALAESPSNRPKFKDIKNDFDLNDFSEEAEIHKIKGSFFLINR